MAVTTSPNSSSTIPTRRRGAAAALAVSAWNVGAARRLQQVVEQHQPTVAHLHNSWFSITPSILPVLRRAGVPVVMTIHNYRLMCANALLLRDGEPCQRCVGTHPWHAVRYGCYRNSRLQSAFAAASIAVHSARGTWVDGIARFLALTPFVADRLAVAGIPADRITIKPNFVSDPGERADPPSRSRTVLFAGRLTSDKGPGLLVDAWEAARPSELELLIAGDGPLRQALEDRAVPGVSFLGAVGNDELRARMLSARAVIFPSVAYEAQPMTILEGFAAGTPVLASRRGAAESMVGALPSGDGWLVEPGSTTAWAQALGGLTDDDERVDLAGADARAAYLASHTPAQGLAGLESVYTAVQR